VLDTIGKHKTEKLQYHVKLAPDVEMLGLYLPKNHPHMRIETKMNEWSVLSTQKAYFHGQTIGRLP
jgi:hypothetical protein